MKNIKYRNIFFIYSILLASLFVLSGCGNNTDEQKQEESQTNTARLSTQSDTSNTENNSFNSENEIRIGAHDDENQEEELSSFSTKLGGKDSPRSRNIGITTSTLNGTTIADGETFSFCGTIRCMYC